MWGEGNVPVGMRPTGQWLRSASNTGRKPGLGLGHLDACVCAATHDHRPCLIGPPSWLQRWTARRIRPPGGSHARLAGTTQQSAAETNTLRQQSAEDCYEAAGRDDLAAACREVVLGTVFVGPPRLQWQDCGRLSNLALAGWHSRTITRRVRKSSPNREHAVLAADPRRREQAAATP